MLFFKRKRLKEIEEKITTLNNNVEKNRECIEILQKVMIDINEKNSQLILNMNNSIQNFIEKVDKGVTENNELITKVQEKVIESVSNSAMNTEKSINKNVDSNHSDSINQIELINNSMKNIGNLQKSLFDNISIQINNSSESSQNNIIELIKQVDDISKVLKEQYEKNKNVHIDIKSTVDKISSCNENNTSLINQIENEIRILLLNDVMNEISD